MIGALLGGVSGLLGGGGGGLFGGGSEPPQPENITQTVTTGAINLGGKNLGRGAVTSSEATAQGPGSSVSSPAQNSTPLYVGAGLVLVVVVLLTLNKGK